MNIYEVNKGMYLNVPPMKEENIKKVIRDFVSNHETRYYLMLNHDIHYYTLFHIHNFCVKSIVEEIYSIIKELGPVLDIINNQETVMLEIWIKYDGEPMMFGLFNYEKGVIEV